MISLPLPLQPTGPVGYTMQCWYPAPAERPGYRYWRPAGEPDTGGAAGATVRWMQNKQNCPDFRGKWKNARNRAVTVESGGSGREFVLQAKWSLHQLLSSSRFECFDTNHLVCVLSGVKCSRESVWLEKTSTLTWYTWETFFSAIIYLT